MRNQRFSWLLFFSATLFLISFLAKPIAIFAACDEVCDQEDYGEKKQCTEQKKSCLEEQLAQTQKQKQTLSSTISLISDKISLQQVQIYQTENEISQLEKQIESLQERITGLNVSLDRLSALLVERIRNEYKQSRVTPLTVFSASENVSDFFKQYKYLRQAGKQTATAMQRAETQRLAYDEQKLLKEEKQEEVEKKRSLLQSQKAVLDKQNQEQKYLLEITNNNEKQFQKLLEEARKELAQIQSAASIVIRDGNEIAIKQGESIGTMGNSGYSFGSHLHFGVYKYSIEEFQSIGEWGWYYSNYINPLEKLQNFSVLWDTSCSNDPSGQQSSGSGSWTWPMKNQRVTQSYGSNTCYNYLYGNKPHPALDLVAIGDPTVYAVADGKGYFCRNCLGDGGNGVFVFHDDGYMSLYWHLK